MLSLRDESPAGENRGGTPAGERARKRRAAQAAFSVARPGRRLRAGKRQMRLPAFRFLYFFVVVVFVGWVEQSETHRSAWWVTPLRG